LHKYQQPLSVHSLTAEPENNPAVWQAIGDICYRTANHRPPPNAEDWEFFSRVWINPYKKLLPQWTYVALADQRVVGYLTGCPNSPAFARAKFFSCTLPLLAGIAFGRFRALDGARRFALRELGIEKKPENIFSASIKRSIKKHYPAHLHMNVDADYQRAGVGRALFERYGEDIRHAGIQGIHVFCAAAPLPFYLRLGFTEIAAAMFKRRAVHALGFRI
jgi:GNAT superfamily N-acetyltransferase